MAEKWVIYGLIGLAGFLLGGVYSTWKTSRGLAVALGIAAVLALGGAAAWWASA